MLNEEQEYNCQCPYCEGLRDRAEKGSDGSVWRDRVKRWVIIGMWVIFAVSMVRCAYRAVINVNGGM